VEVLELRQGRARTRRGWASLRAASGRPLLLAAAEYAELRARAAAHFATADVDGDGRLSWCEFERYLGGTWPTEAEAFAGALQWPALCARYGAEPAAGLDGQAFLAFVLRLSYEGAPAALGELGAAELRHRAACRIQATFRGHRGRHAHHQSVIDGARAALHAAASGGAEPEAFKTMAALHDQVAALTATCSELTGLSPRHPAPHTPPIRRSADPPPRRPAR
jgi:hypothetical protein